MRKKMLIAVFSVIVMLAVAISPVGAITNGQPDGNNHPYVGIALGPATGGGFWVCSAAAISPTVLVTAAHCFEGPEVFVSFVEVPPLLFFSTQGHGILTLIGVLDAEEVSQDSIHTMWR